MNPGTVADEAITKFKRDHLFRAQLFHPDSFKHQGKANLNQLLALLQYIQPPSNSPQGGEKTSPPLGGTEGGPILDPLAGTGSTLIYLDYGLPVICGELEAHWAKLCETNRKTISGSRLFANSTPALCNQWDAARLPLANESVAAIITSPPYWDMLSDWHLTSHNLQANGHETYGICYGLHPGNIGNIHIYENYLRAMFAVYAECYRVLRPGHIMVLILKDRVHKRRRVPITADTITLAAALGFRLVDRLDRVCTPSFHRNVLQQKFPGSPVVDNEPALVFEKGKRPDIGAETRFAKVALAKVALVGGPKPDSAPSCQLFRKALRYCDRAGTRVYVLTRYGLKNRFAGLEIERLAGPDHRGYRRRKEFAFACVAGLVTKYGKSAGAEIELHCPMDYGRYVTHRAETLGMKVTNPTQGLNLGQKLKWYTEHTK